MPTRGIAYANLLLPLKGLPERLVPLLPLFARSLTELGTARRDFTELGAYMAAKTGGVGADTLLGTTRGERRTFSYLSLAGKAVYDKIPDLFGIFHEILLEPLRDPAVARERLRQMLLEGKARLEHGLQAAGHTAVGTRLRAHFTGAGALAERTGGVSYLASIRGLLEQLETQPEALLADLEELRALVMSASGAVFDCTAEAGAWPWPRTGPAPCWPSCLPTARNARTTKPGPCATCPWPRSSWPRPRSTTWAKPPTSMTRVMSTTARPA